MKTSAMIGWIVFLCGCDQLIKAIVHCFCLGENVELIPGFLAFYPIYNYKFAYVFHLAGLDVGAVFYYILSLFIGAVYFFLYKLLRFYTQNQKLLDVSFAFVASALICSFVSNLFWGGVLDYICLKPLFVFDLKDLCVWIGIGLLLIHQAKDARSGVQIKRADVKRFAKIFFRRAT